ncbi:cytochrome c3 family protein [Altererythrobacter sp. CC-YST694]|uniref:cytochrome c3 family protein n=1 Tax=Altererythrobacter sp. CC-YST694 TaxID=2755038 RepID=UPI001D02C8D6|nr:cytochrome c3 family protein [Altererythrobacter sp. CC-YST694]MCB5425779.1 cytochrome c3 family protein [Altererythrobacter sp. CC-YST694]
MTAPGPRTGRALLAGIAVALMVLLALLFIYPHQMIAPGPLIPAHAELEQDCFACHAPLRGASPTRCVTCHVPTEIGVKTTKGELIRSEKPKVAFHAQLQDADCMACHTDHAAALLTRNKPKSFAHDLLKPAVATQCASCHAKPKDGLHATITGQCAQCHTTNKWTPASFAHDRYFQLDADHNVACTTCHIGNQFERYTCYGCHEHQPARIIAEHAEEGIRDIENCTRCHRSPHGKIEGDRRGEEERER